MKKTILNDTYVQILIVFVLIACLALTMYGFYQLSWPQFIAWSPLNTVFIFFGVISVVTFLTALVSWWFKVNVGVAAFFVAIFIAIIAGDIWPLLVVIWFAVASTMFGYLLLNLLKIEGVDWINCFLIGAGVYGTVAGLLAHFPVNYSGVYGVALSVPIIVGWRFLVDKNNQLMFKKNIANIDINWLELAISAVVLIYFIVALMPEFGYDALVSHLFVASHLSLRHQWGFDVNKYVWSVMPMLGDWIYAIGYMFAGEVAARMINVGFILLLANMVRKLIIWAGGSVVGARWGVLIFLSSPLTFTEGSSLFIESIWTAFVISGTLLIFNICTNVKGKLRTELPIVGLLLGFALATKALTLTIIPGLFFLLIWRYKLWIKEAGLKYFALGIGFFSLFGGVPYLTAWKITGNPLFPLYNKIFKSPYFTTAIDFNNPTYNSGLSWDLIYRATFESGKYLESSAGAPGFQWILLFIPTFLTFMFYPNQKTNWLFFIGLLALGITFHSQSYLRYVFPSSLILTAAIGVGISQQIKINTLKKYVWVSASILTIFLNLLFISAGAQYKDFPVQSVFSQDKRDAYLLSRLPIRNAINLVNTLNIGNAPIAVFAEPFVTGLSADAFYANWYNKNFQTEIETLQTEQQLANILLTRNINYVILDVNWNGLNCCHAGTFKQEIIEKVTETIATYGSVNVRKIKSEYRFKNQLPIGSTKFEGELLSNANFESLKSWAYAPIAYDAIGKIVLVSNSTPITEKIAVIPGQRYLLSAVARCYKQKTLGRLQINWGDTKQQSITAELKTFECTSDWTEWTLEVRAPDNAAYGEVYVNGHTSTPLEFKRVSLRQ